MCSGRGPSAPKVKAAPVAPAIVAPAASGRSNTILTHGLRHQGDALRGGTLYAAAAQVATDAAHPPQAARPAAQAPAQAAPAQSAAAQQPAQAQGVQPQANLPAGIRNNNPGNLHPLRGDRWQGQTGTAGGFSVFDTPENGLRGMAVLLTTYHQTHGLRTVDGIIRRYAPRRENNTQSYINHVSNALGITPNQEIDLRDRSVFSTMMNTMIRHENGQNPYSNQQISDAIDRAWEHRDRRR